MAAQLFYLPFRPALDMNALALPDAKLYFYYTGGTTKAPVYSDAALSVALANPVEADAAGRWPSIYMNDAITYRVVLKDSTDTTVPGHDVDPYLASIADALTTELSDLAEQVATDAAQVAEDRLVVESAALYPASTRYQIASAILDYPAGIPEDSYTLALAPVASRITDIYIDFVGTGATLTILAGGVAIYGPASVTGDVTLIGQDISTAEGATYTLLVDDILSATYISVAINGHTD